MPMINDIHEGAFDELVESIKRGDWSPVIPKHLQCNFYEVKNCECRIWVGGGKYNLDLSNSSSYYYYFTFLQKIKLWRLLKPIIQAGEAEVKRNNKVLFKASLNKGG